MFSDAGQVPHDARLRPGATSRSREPTTVTAAPRARRWSAGQAPTASPSSCSAARIEGTIMIAATKQPCEHGAVGCPSRCTRRRCRPSARHDVRRRGRAARHVHAVGALRRVPGARQVRADRGHDQGRHRPRRRSTRAHGSAARSPRSRNGGSRREHLGAQAGGAVRVGLREREPATEPTTRASPGSYVEVSRARRAAEGWLARRCRRDLSRPRADDGGTIKGTVVDADGKLRVASR